MIEKTEETKHKWNISFEEYETAVISVDNGQLWINLTDKQPEIAQAKELYQALGEAIAVAEAQDE